MNQTQRKILKGAMAAIVTTLIFPPFVATGGNNCLTIGLGYGFILSWTRLSSGLVGHVDVALLLTEWLAIGIVASILWALTSDHRGTSIVSAILSRNDALVEAARIEAYGRERAAEIIASRQDDKAT